ncbi:alpha-glucosidase [Marinitoga aeolica]|jgi:alpha-glucosidase|uniref:Alpha-glucosidase n=2 Tax=Petrotogaceae TaxID=1643949 RepID=A0ABY8PSM3_9BACT|nr:MULTISPECIES: alpha-glucosidase [Marinitoga]MBM7558719.1 alpha-glucosidase [Marinitoga litoralis]WGS65622.1 alpha-glucosidase [Marinitoga aeolica]
MIIDKDNGFEIIIGKNKLLSHSKENPSIFLGYGKEKIDMYRGNFDINDYLESRIPLRNFNIAGNIISFYEDGKTILKMEIKDNEITFENYSNYNRFWIRLNATKNEDIYGCGEQFSYFNLRGKIFPLWTSEPGVGRNKKTYITWLADVEGKAGGDYYTTNFPQSAFLSSNMYYCIVDSSVYMKFDFSHVDFHEIEVWDIPKRISFITGENYLEIISKFNKYMGIQPKLPEWILDGLILGVQGGLEEVNKKLEKLSEVKINALWVQDWVGKKITSFGKRLFWDWKVNEKYYPNLKEYIEELNKRNIRFLGYINPYLIREGELFKEADKKGYFVKNKKGDTYLIDFGEFYCGTIDLTNEKAFNWYKEVIKKNMIDLGFSGWMADFGEYLPIDCVLENGDPKEMHNMWPVLWAKLNYEAVKESGKLGEIVFFMRAGFNGIQKYTTLMWAGDQLVDWSEDDGIPSVVKSFLSSAISGIGYTHCDLGGYTSLFEVKRSKELMKRWIELSAFSPVMRSHEGNRPDDNIQVYSDEELIEYLKKMTEIHSYLKDYLLYYIDEYQEKGIPLIRPLMLHYNVNSDKEYLLGRDLLICPVLKENTKNMEVLLPEDEWINLWTKEKYNGGKYVVNSEIIPVFYRASSKFKELFDNL